MVVKGSQASKKRNDDTTELKRKVRLGDSNLAKWFESYRKGERGDRVANIGNEVDLGRRKVLVTN